LLLMQLTSRTLHCPLCPSRFDFASRNLAVFFFRARRFFSRSGRVFLGARRFPRLSHPSPSPLPLSLAALSHTLHKPQYSEIEAGGRINVISPEIVTRFFPRSSYFVSSVTIASSPLPLFCSLNHILVKKGGDSSTVIIPTFSNQGAAYLLSNPSLKF